MMNQNNKQNMMLKMKKKTDVFIVFCDTKRLFDVHDEIKFNANMIISFKIQF